jgi:hypothetical protein
MEAGVHTDLDTLATALYVRIDDELKARPELNGGGRRSASSRKSPTLS